MREIKQLRNYAGAPLPLPLQAASAAVWDDEAHVAENRALYIEKYEVADRILGNVPGYQSPEAGFFLWLPVEDDEAAALKLWRENRRAGAAGRLSGAKRERRKPRETLYSGGDGRPKEETTRGIEAIRRCLYPE